MNRNEDDLRVGLPQILEPFTCSYCLELATAHFKVLHKKHTIVEQLVSTPRDSSINFVINRLTHGQLHVESGAFVGARRFGPDTAFVRLHHTLNKRETKASRVYVNFKGILVSPTLSKELWFEFV